MMIVILASPACKGNDAERQLRQQCESIVREAHPEWKGRPIFEKAVGACVSGHGAGFER
jgi:hypothetical protein